MSVVNHESCFSAEEQVLLTCEPGLVEALLSHGPVLDGWGLFSGSTHRRIDILSIV